MMRVFRIRSGVAKLQGIVFVLSHAMFSHNAGEASDTSFYFAGLFSVMTALTQARAFSALGKPM